MNHITFWGNGSQTGAYVLWLRAREDMRIAFGRFQGGRAIAVPVGRYAYVGSAMGRGASALAGRLLRHATRTGDKPPHPIRKTMEVAFAAEGLGSPLIRPLAQKRLRWHIDYLLDEMKVAIEAVWVVRVAARVESELARGLAAAPGVVPLAPGLGASDAPGATHLLRLPDEGLDAPALLNSILTDGEMAPLVARHDTGSSPRGYCR